jgi:hypothetical protein
MKVPVNYPSREVFLETLESCGFNVEFQAALGADAL